MKYQICIIRNLFKSSIKHSSNHPLYPHDASLPPCERINCHCISQPIVDDDIIGMSLEEREKLQGRALNTDNKAWKEEQKALARDNKKKYQKRRRNRNKTLDNSSKSGKIKVDIQLFAKRIETDMKNQSSTSLRRGIRSYEKKVTEHKLKLQKPQEYVPDWDSYSEKHKQGLMKHWNKEISNFEDSIQRRITELKLRGDYDD